MALNHKTLPPHVNLEQDLRDALFVAHYHLALHHPKNAEWADRAQQLSRQDRLDLRPAINRVQAAHAAITARDHRATKRLWPLLNHANAALAQVHKLSRKPLDVLRHHLSSPAGLGPAFGEIEGTSNNFGDTLAAAYGKLANIPDLKFEKIAPQSCFFDASGVTRFNAQISRGKVGEENFDNIARDSDPRNWQNVFKGMFKTSCDIGDKVVPDRYVDPKLPKHTEPHRGQPSLGEPWNGHLFEQWQWLDYATFRNLLSVEVTRNEFKENGERKSKLPAERRMEFTYSLYESLSNEIEGQKAAGGIDVDSNDPGSCEVKMKNQRIYIAAGKNIRFSEDAGLFQFELNMMSLPFLSSWITSLLLTAASFKGDQPSRPSTRRHGIGRAPRGHVPRAH